MPRTVLVAASLVLVASSTFIGVSSAVSGGQGPQIRSNLPVAALPAVAMAESDAAEIRSLIGEFLLLRAGITAASFSQLRLLGDTEVGPLYFVPGSLGACVVLSTRAASCGDPGASDQSQIVVAARVPDRGIFIGGGVTSRSVRALEAVRADGSRVPVNVVEGRFILNRTHALSTLQEVVGSE